MDHIDLERIALWAILVIAAITLLFLGIYPLFHMTVDPTISNVLAGCTGALFTFLRVYPKPKESENQFKEEDKEEPKKTDSEGTA